jgi:hypothetical protein
MLSVETMSTRPGGTVGKPAQPQRATGQVPKDGEAVWIATQDLRAEIARRVNVSDGGLVVRELVGPGCTVGTLRERLAAKTKLLDLDLDQVRDLALAESWVRGHLLILPTPKPAKEAQRRPAKEARQRPAKEARRRPAMGEQRRQETANGSRRPSAVALAGKDRKTIDRVWRDAEAFLNEPLTVHVKRALRSGSTPAEVVRQVARRSQQWARLTGRQVLWLAEQPDPDPRRWVRPDRPGVGRDPEQRRGGFWESIRNERYVREVGGGLPTLGKRR